jgi:hypothetical protein
VNAIALAAWVARTREALESAERCVEFHRQQQAVAQRQRDALARDLARYSEQLDAAEALT